MVAVPVTPPDHPVLLVNPLSGGGKAQRYDLVGECRSRGIETLLLHPGQDLSLLAEEAISTGADAIGMAGGDGSQAVVAAAAAAHGLPYVCVPAGTRNHFALDIGVDRHDVVGALDAYRGGTERPIDLARINGRIFVNNASMGLYGQIVQSPEYRDAKLRTVIKMLPETLTPGAAPFDLRFAGPDGVEHAGADVLIVSNNPYQLDPREGRGTRGAMNQGTLGIVAAPGGRPPQRVIEWTTPAFRVESGSPVHVGLDGEATTLTPPLLFESLPLALRIRIPVRRRRRPRSG